MTACQASPFIPPAFACALLWEEGKPFSFFQEIFYVNAWQVMPGGGGLYFETENVTLYEDYAVQFICVLENHDLCAWSELVGSAWKQHPMECWSTGVLE